MNLDALFVIQMTIVMTIVDGKALGQISSEDAQQMGGDILEESSK